MISSQANYVAGENGDHKSMVSNFLQNVLPIDISRYTTVLRDQNTTSDSFLTAKLTSEQSIITINFYTRNSILSGFHLFVDNGSIIYDKSYSNLNDIAISFLSKYQSFSNLDSKEIIDTIPKIDTTKNSTQLEGNVKIIITVQDGTAEDSVGYKYVNFEWRRNLQGVDYPLIHVAFQNGALYSFSDFRNVYTIGDTTVNVSREQAISAAMEYVKTYSYALSDGSKVSGFKLNESRTEATLTCGTSNSTTLYPMWKVVLFLDHVYPGSVKAFSVAVWASSGKVFGISPYTERLAPPQYYDQTRDPSTVLGNL